MCGRTGKKSNFYHFQGWHFIDGFCVNISYVNEEDVIWYHFSWFPEGHGLDPGAQKGVMSQSNLATTSHSTRSWKHWQTEGLLWTLGMENAAQPISRCQQCLLACFPARSPTCSSVCNRPCAIPGGPRRLQSQMKVFTKVSLAFPSNVASQLMCWLRSHRHLQVKEYAHLHFVFPCLRARVGSLRDGYQQESQATQDGFLCLPEWKELASERARARAHAFTHSTCLALAGFSIVSQSSSGADILQLRHKKNVSSCLTPTRSHCPLSTAMWSLPVLSLSWSTSCRRSTSVGCVQSTRWTTRPCTATRVLSSTAPKGLIRTPWNSCPSSSSTWPSLASSTPSLLPSSVLSSWWLGSSTPWATGQACQRGASLAPF